MTIRFRATRHFLPLLVSAIIAGAGILFLVLLSIDYYPKGHGRGIPAILGTVIGITVYFVFLKLTRTVISKDYCMEFAHSGIEIRSGRTYIEEVNYTDIDTFTICNKGDYSKIVINTAGKRDKYFVGLANLKFTTILDNKNDFCILESFSEMDSIFFGNGFERSTDESTEKKAAMQIVEYKRK